MTQEQQLERMWRIRKQYIKYRTIYVHRQGLTTKEDTRVARARMNELKELYLEMKMILLNKNKRSS